MVNVTVVKGKDVIKYLVRITVIILLIFILSRYFSRFKEIEAVSELKEEKNNTLISCLDETIPKAKQVKGKVIQDEKEEKEPIKDVLAKELGMIDAITKKDVTIEKLVNEQSSITSEESNNLIDDNNDLQVDRKCRKFRDGA